MKKDIHPKEYRPVIFEDSSSGKRFLIASTVATKKTDTWDGKTYPLYTVEISSASHPFYTGKATIVDSAGRVERFKARATAAKSKRATSTGKKKHTTQ